MFIMSKRNIIIPSPDGKTSKKLYKGYVGPVENWVAQTDYFKSLVKDKKIIVTETTKDNELEKADAEKPVDNARDKADVEVEETEKEETDENKDVETSKTTKGKGTKKADAEKPEE